MLEIKNVSKSYGNKKVLDNVSLKIKKGKIFGFIGENGAGKTTLIKAIVGIHDFDSGDILIDGVSIKENPVLCKKKMAYVPDNPSEREIVFCISDYEQYKAGTMWYFFDGKKKKITAFEMPEDFLCFADSSDTLLTPWGDLQFHPKIIYASWNSIILPELGTYTIMYNAKYGEVPSNIGYDNEDPWFTLNLTKSYTGKEYAKALDPEADVENETNDIVFNGIQSQVLECLPSYIAATLLEQDDLQRAMILRNEFESMAQRLEDRVLYENEHFVSPGGWY